MSFWDDLTGRTAANASTSAAAGVNSAAGNLATADKSAAGDTYAKQQGAIGKLLGYGDEYAGKFDNLAQGYAPFVAGGTANYEAANNALTNLWSNPESVRSLPGYQFNVNEGTRAIDHSAAARGMDASGRTLKDLTRFGQGTADNFFGNWLQRLMAGSQQGYQQATGAIGAGNALTAEGLRGQLGTRGSAYQGDYNSAGTIGQGDINAANASLYGANATAQGKIAGANAEAAGSQNLLNTGLKLGGMALGAFGGGSGAFGGGGTTRVGAIGADNWLNPDYVPRA